MNEDNAINVESAAGSAKSRLQRVLLLGGTSDAAELATRMVKRDDFTVISSLAGRVNQPRLPAGTVRVGGFGGVEGLIRYLADEKIDAVVDATHPFASRISGNAETACSSLSIPLIAFERPAWEPQAGDCWQVVPDMRAAASLVNRQENRVFLSIGRQELGAFSQSERGWFLVRAIDPPTVDLPPNSELILRRGPFELADELQLLRDHRINLIVSKNSGGAATYSKIEAARQYGIPVVIVARPTKHTVPVVAQIEDVLRKLAEVCRSPRVDRHDTIR